MDKNYKYRCDSCNSILEHRDNMFICDPVNGCNKSVEITEGLEGLSNNAYGPYLVLENVWMIELPGSKVARSIIKEDNVKIIRIGMKSVVISM